MQHRKCVIDIYRESSGIRSSRLKQAIARNRRRQLQKRAVFSDKLGSLGHPEGLRSTLPLPPTSRTGERTTVSRVGSRKPRVSGRLKQSSLASKLRRTEAPTSIIASQADSVTKQQTWYQKLLIYGGWIFCSILSGRLVFAERGVIDYYSQEKLIQSKIYQNELIAKENSELLTEINLLNEDPVYQRKVVRKHLGVIAKDEYLIVFVREKYSL